MSGREARTLLLQSHDGACRHSVMRRADGSPPERKKTGRSVGRWGRTSPLQRSPPRLSRHVRAGAKGTAPCLTTDLSSIPRFDRPRHHAVADPKMTSSTRPARGTASFGAIGKGVTSPAPSVGSPLGAQTPQRCSLLFASGGPLPRLTKLVMSTRPTPAPSGWAAKTTPPMSCGATDHVLAAPLHLPRCRSRACGVTATIAERRRTTPCVASGCWLPPGS